MLKKIEKCERNTRQFNYAREKNRHKAVLLHFNNSNLFKL